ncbi:hypothetical protein HOH87_04510 [bacterium]|jgi:hypothetical protein|nr:hypothetical protein [bacterium]
MSNFPPPVSVAGKASILTFSGLPVPTPPPVGIGDRLKEFAKGAFKAVLSVPVNTTPDEGGHMVSSKELSMTGAVGFDGTSTKIILLGSAEYELSKLNQLEPAKQAVVKKSVSVVPANGEGVRFSGGGDINSESNYVMDPLYLFLEKNEKAIPVIGSFVGQVPASFIDAKKVASIMKGESVTWTEMFGKARENPLRMSELAGSTGSYRVAQRSGAVLAMGGSKSALQKNGLFCDDKTGKLTVLGRLVGDGVGAIGGSILAAPLDTLNVLYLANFTNKMPRTYGLVETMIKPSVALATEVTVTSRNALTLFGASCVREAYKVIKDDCLSKSQLFNKLPSELKTVVELGIRTALTSVVLAGTNPLELWRTDSITQSQQSVMGQTGKSGDLIKLPELRGALDRAIKKTVESFSKGKPPPGFMERIFAGAVSLNIMFMVVEGLTSGVKERCGKE